MGVKKYDVLFYIGRFQPLHNGHISIINRALELADRVVIMVGTPNSYRSLRNPFTYEEVSNCIKTMYPDNNVHVVELRDAVYSDDLWIQEVLATIGKEILYKLLGSSKCAIIGCDKDSTTYYLKMLEQYIDIEYVKTDNQSINSTDIRYALYNYGNIIYLKEYIPNYVYTFLENFRSTREFVYLKNEYDFCTTFKRPYMQLKYPPIFSTVDGLILTEGEDIEDCEILLIKRKNYPGKDLYALPGGFINHDETIVGAFKRELSEEIGIVPDFIDDPIVFDSVHRDPRGRIITHCFCSYYLNKPEIKVGDDAEDYIWIKYSNLDNIRDKMYSDHYDIIKKLFT